MMQYNCHPKDDAPPRRVAVPDSQGRFIWRPAIENDMSAKNQGEREQPLTKLVSDLGHWLGRLNREGLRRRGEGSDDPDQVVTASVELEEFREPAKAIIIWLELRGRDTDAAEVDDAMADLRETARHYDAGELQPVFIERSDEPVSPLDQFIEAASRAAGRLEDLDGTIPASVWRGYDDA